ncbi:MAG: hypothetical protein J7496_09665 [Novosphingobium sp.]|nr:hypothetical protein [Novosphingobium sp.]
MAALVGGGVLAAAALVACVLVPGALAGWLAAVTAVCALPAGALVLSLMMRLIPGVWGEELRLSTEAMTLLTPWAALAFVPVVAGLGAIYPWMRDAKLSALQQLTLTPLCFAAVSAVRFAALWALGRRMRARRRTRATAAAGLVALPLLAGLAAFEWLLSLDPGFASSAFGLQFLERELTIAFAALLLLRLSLGRPPARPSVLGGLMLTLLLLWAYFEFLPFFINWSSDEPDGAAWYLARARGGWGVLLWIWAALSGVPLLALLFAKARNSVAALRWIAGTVIVGKLCELAWVTLPGFGIPAIAVDVAATGGLALVCAALLPSLLYRRIERRMPKEANR